VEVPSNFDQFFKVFAYGIVGIPQQLSNANLSPQYTTILQNVCIDVDDDLVANVIGFFRNFIAKAKSQIRNYKDEIGVSFLEYLYKIVDTVIGAKKETN
jgi:hypothetical protein